MASAWLPASPSSPRPSRLPRPPAALRAGRGLKGWAVGAGTAAAPAEGQAGRTLPRRANLGRHSPGEAGGSRGGRTLRQGHGAGAPPAAAARLPPLRRRQRLAPRPADPPDAPRGARSCGADGGLARAARQAHAHRGAAAPGRGGRDLGFWRAGLRHSAALRRLGAPGAGGIGGVLPVPAASGQCGVWMEPRSTITSHPECAAPAAGAPGGGLTLCGAAVRSASARAAAAAAGRAGRALRLPPPFPPCVCAPGTGGQLHSSRRAPAWRRGARAPASSSARAGARAHLRGRTRRRRRQAKNGSMAVPRKQNGAAGRRLARHRSEPWRGCDKKKQRCLTGARRRGGGGSAPPCGKKAGGRSEPAASQRLGGFHDAVNTPHCGGQRHE
jgi:hypothetical protein